jgi:DNA polymerase bacteriophage-type
VPILHRDYETYSELDLGDVGAWKYTKHHSAEVLCCAYCVDDGPIKLWVPGDPIPTEFIAAAEDPSYIVSAFNDSFERAVETHILGPRYGWPLIPIERHRCLQASALALALPDTLELVAEALNLTNRKDMDGHKFMKAVTRDPSKYPTPESRERTGNKTGAPASLVCSKGRKHHDR